MTDAQLAALKAGLDADHPTWAVEADAVVADWANEKNIPDVERIPLDSVSEWMMDREKFTDMTAFIEDVGNPLAQRQKAASVLSIMLRPGGRTIKRATMASLVGQMEAVGIMTAQQEIDILAEFNPLASWATSKGLPTVHHLDVAKARAL